MGAVEIARYQGGRIYVFFLAALTFFCFYLMVGDLAGGPREFWIDDVIRITSFSVVAAFLTSFLILPTILLQTIFDAPVRYLRPEKTVGSYSVGLKFIFACLMTLPLSIFLTSSLLVQVLSGEVYTNSFQKLVALEDELDFSQRDLDLGLYYMALLETLTARVTERLYLVVAGTPQYVLLISLGFIGSMVMLPVLSKLFSISLENVSQYRLMRSLCQKEGVIVDDFTVYTPSGQEVSVTSFVKLKPYFERLEKQKAADRFKQGQDPQRLKSSALFSSLDEMDLQIKSARQKLNFVLKIDGSGS